MEMESIRQECQVIRSNVAIKFSECSDGIEAVNTVTARGGDAFDAIFMDNIMISMNGAEATRHIRSLGFTGVMIAVSGNVLKDDVDAFFAAGADYFVEKPLQRARHYCRYCIPLLIDKIKLLLRQDALLSSLELQ